MPESGNGGGAVEKPRVRWGDLLIVVGVAAVVVAVMLLPPVRRVWMPVQKPDPKPGE